jgi:hypothetical protein
MRPSYLITSRMHKQNGTRSATINMHENPTEAKMCASPIPGKEIPVFFTLKFIIKNHGIRENQKVIYKREGDQK